MLAPTRSCVIYVRPDSRALRLKFETSARSLLFFLAIDDALRFLPFVVDATGLLLRVAVCLLAVDSFLDVEDFLDVLLREAFDNLHDPAGFFFFFLSSAAFLLPDSPDRGYLRIRIE